MPSVIAEGNAAAHRILIGHPFNPPELMPLVEVVRSMVNRITAGIVVACTGLDSDGAADMEITVKDATLTGDASAVAPGSLWTGESLFGGTGYDYGFDIIEVADGVREFMFVLGQNKYQGAVQSMINPVAIR